MYNCKYTVQSVGSPVQASSITRLYSSPNPTRLPSFSVHPLNVTLSPSSIKDLSFPSDKVIGSFPPQQISSIDPNEPGSGPLIVPDAIKSPMRTLHPFDV